MILQGKKILFLGDSITEGVGASSVATNYVSIFKEMTGSEVVNYGISGTRIAKVRTPSEIMTFDNDFLQRVDEMQDDADVIIVFGGTNDYGHGRIKLGEFNSMDEYTFYGALHALCIKLLNKYPGAELVFLTPLHRLDEDGIINSDGDITRPLAEYSAAIQEVAGYYGLPVLDLFHTSGIQPNVNIIKEIYMPDGLHPSDEGARRIACRIKAFLDMLE